MLSFNACSTPLILFGRGVAEVFAANKIARRCHVSLGVVARKAYNLSLSTQLTEAKDGS